MQGETIQDDENLTGSKYIADAHEDKALIREDVGQSIESSLLSSRSRQSSCVWYSSETIVEQGEKPE